MLTLERPSARYFEFGELDSRLVPDDPEARNQFFTRVAHRLGYDKINSVGRAVVFAKIAAYTVIKITVDGAYRQFAEYAQAHPDNPHLPMIFEAVHYENGVSVYVIERLKGIEPPDDFDTFVCAKDLKGLASPAVHACADRFRLQHPDLAVTIDDLYRARCDWHTSDLSSSNIMGRGNTIVVIDPWC